MSNYNWLYGCIVAIFGAVGSNMGINVQKYSMVKNSKLPESEQKHHCSQPIWFFGLILVILGAIADFAALSLAAQSIVAPIGAVTLVANLFFAYFWLGEALAWKDFIGTVLVVLGAVLSVAFGNHTDVTYTLSEIKSYYTQTTFIAYLAATLFISLVCYLVILFLEPIRDDLLLAYVAFDDAENEADTTKIREYEITIQVINKQYERWQKIHPVTYCCIAGFFGSYSILQAKAVSTMMRTSLNGENQFFEYLTYIFIFVMIATILIQTNYLAYALKYFDALYVVPVFQCFWILGSTLGGAIFFGEFSGFNLLQTILFPVGVVITLIGVAILSTREMTRCMEKKNKDLDRVSVFQKEKMRQKRRNSNSVISMESNLDERALIDKDSNSSEIRLISDESLTPKLLLSPSVTPLEANEEEDVISPIKNSIPVTMKNKVHEMYIRSRNIESGISNDDTAVSTVGHLQLGRVIADTVNNIIHPGESEDILSVDRARTRMAEINVFKGNPLDTQKKIMTNNYLASPAVKPSSEHHF